MQSEARLLFAAGRGSVPRALRHQVLSDPAAVERLLAMAHRERAMLPLWRVLSGGPEGLSASVPAEAPATDVFRSMARIAEFASRRVRAHLEDVATRLGERGIHVVLLKGAALATSVYARFDDRPMADLDLLVSPEHASRAWKALVEAGWRPDGARGLDIFYHEHHHLRPLEAPDGSGVVVELHRDLLPPEAPFRFGAEAVWAEAFSARLGRAEVLVPSLVHMALHACLHFGWSGMLSSGAWRTFRDLRALERAGLDWGELAAGARAAGAASCCYWTLRLAERMGFVDVPAEVLAELRPPGPHALRSFLERHYLAAVGTSLEPACPSVRMDRLLWHAAVRPRRSGHGPARPWRTGLRFEEAGGEGGGPEAGGRRGSLEAGAQPGAPRGGARPWSKVRRHLDAGERWVRYMRLLGAGS